MLHVLPLILLSLLCPSKQQTMPKRSFNIMISAAGTSHRLSLMPMAEALGEKGHNVHFWWADVVNETTKAKFVKQHMVLSEVDDRVYLDNFQRKNDTSVNSLIWRMTFSRPWDLGFTWLFNEKVCSGVAKKRPEELAKAANLEKWDLIILDPYGALSGAPYLIWSPTYTAISTALYRSLPIPVSYVPNNAASATTKPHQSFLDRVQNTVLHLAFYPIIPFANYMVRKSLQGIHDDFSFSALDRSALHSVTWHALEIDWPRPKTHDVITSPLHLVPGHTDQLESELRAFVEDPRSLGTIVIGMGHIVKWSGSPWPSYLAFESALIALTDYRILWQHDWPIRELPPHIKQLPWIPQIALLRHPKTVLFISHAGTKSVIEAISTGVPMVAMPQLAEGFRNTNFITSKGAGVYLDKFNLSTLSVSSAIAEILSNSSYRQNIVRLQQLSADKIMSAVDWEVYIVERALRRGNVLRSVLRNRGSDLQWFQYHCLDVLFVLGGLCLLVIRFLALNPLLHC